MKKQFVSSVFVLLASAFAFAQEPTVIGDRMILDPVGAPDVIGILHSENFEYICEVTVNDDKDAEGKPQMFTTQAFIDTDFAEGSGYRYAMAFPGYKLLGMIGAEVKVVSVAKGRCPGLCLSMDLQAPEGEKSRATILENPVTKVISINVVEAGSKEVEVSGTCRANEPE